MKLSELRGGSTWDYCIEDFFGNVEVRLHVQFVVANCGTSTIEVSPFNTLGMGSHYYVKKLFVLTKSKVDLV